jgi:hypothetical protein
VISTRHKTNDRKNQSLSREGILWCLTNGEAGNMNNRAIAVDGIHSVVNILDRVENDKLPGLDFLELRSCDQSCAGGILLTGNRFLTVERLKNRAANYPEAQVPDQADVNIELLKQKINSKPVEHINVNRFGSDRLKAIEKMRLSQKIVCQLPGIDCSACGSPNCLALADDIVQQKAKMSDCIFLQQRWQANGKINPHKGFENFENKWGKGRFEPDCNKKGARNEGY